MPNLYNRPRWTLPYLVNQLRTQSSIPALFAMLGASLFLLGGVTPPATPPPGAPLDVVARLADLGGGLLATLGLLPAGPGAREAGALLALSTAAALALTSMTRLLRETGFRDGMILQVGLLCGFASILGSTAWGPGPEALLALAMAGTLRAAWLLRLEGRRQDAGWLALFVALGLVLDRRFVVLLPLLPSTAIPPRSLPRQRLAFGLTLAVALAVLGAWVHGLPEAGRSLLLEQLAPGELLRRLLAALVGVGSSLFVAAPPALLAVLGMRKLGRYDRKLARLTLGSALLYGLARLVLVATPREAAVPLSGYAPLVPCLAPAVAFGLLRLKGRGSGGLLVVLLGLAGAALQAQRFLVDPGFVLRRIEQGGFEYPLDRSFSPELAEPVLGLACLRAHFAGQELLRLRLPSVRGRVEVTLSTAHLLPRPWPVRLWRGEVRPPAIPDSQPHVHESLMPGSDGPTGAAPGDTPEPQPTSPWRRALGTLVALVLAALGVLAAAILGERLSLARKVHPASGPKKEAAKAAVG